MTRHGRTWALLLAVLAGSLAVLGLGAPAQAARTITIVIKDGAVPAVTTAAAGDRVRFTNASQTSSFQVTGAFTTGPIAPGGTSAVSVPLAGGSPATRYDYGVAFAGLLPLPSGGGTVAVGPAPKPSPTAPAPTTSSPSAPTAAPAPGSTAPGSTAPGTTAPGAPASGPSTSAPGTLGGTAGGSGGSGIALQPRLDTGSLLLPAPEPTAGGPAPLVAPLLPGEAAPFGPGFESVYEDLLALPTAPAVPGVEAFTTPGALTERLNAPQTLRQYGLPTVVGLVLLVGVGSLVVRVVLSTTPLGGRPTA